jgi:hypothetical protein
MFMNPTTMIEIPAASESLVRRLLAYHEELQALALTAPDGTVIDACEEAVIERGRKLEQDLLADAVARRIESAEKKGRRSGSVRAVRPRPIAGPRVGSM